jgi:uncharacterized protein DUF1573
METIHPAPAKEPEESAATSRDAAPENPGQDRREWILPAVLAAVAVGLVGFAAFGRLWVGPQKPRAVFSVLRQEVGEVQAGGTATARFLFRNTGRGALRILGISGECGCLAPEYPRKLGPGKQGEIRIRFEPQALWSGKIEKGVQVHTDDPRQPRVRLVVAADVVPAIRTEPPAPVVVSFLPGGSYSPELCLIPSSGRPVTISRPVSDSPLVRPELLPPAPSDPQHAYLLRLRIGPVREAGDFMAKVRLSTSEPRVPHLEVQVVGVAITGPVVNPKQIFRPALDSHASGTELQRLELFCRQGRFQVLEVRTGNPGLRAQLETEAPGRFYRVVLTYSGGWRPGTVTGTVRIRTDDAKALILSIPYRIQVR